MKKIFIRSLIGLGILIILLAATAFGFFLKMKSELKGMNPIETKEIVNNIFSVKDSFVNFFLIKDSNQYVAIDAGNNIDVISNELKKLNINPDQIVAVMLTHTDRDHIAALKLFQHAKTYFSKPEVQMLNGKKSKFLFFRNKIDTENYMLLDDRQIVHFGNTKIKCLLVPGHTAGSMCYIVNEKYLFTGDVITMKDGEIDKPIDFFNMDSKAANKSVKLLTKIPGVEYIFTAHTGFTGNYNDAVKNWSEK